MLTANWIQGKFKLHLHRMQQFSECLLIHKTQKEVCGI